ncbi:ABC transporter ATP-binding protein [Barrientosiimonas marina]|uniref:Nickel import system ATP-binding protein NikD n=1 Tax=Lentibacillus kimchii TaxID=1542911 RepID=A0ABW2UVG8_9BACI
MVLPAADKTRRPFAEHEGEPLFEVQNMSLTFHQYHKGWQEMTSQVISDVELAIHEGEVVAVVGASGSGKSLLADAILGLLPVNAEVSGRLSFAGEPLTDGQQERLRGRDITLIPQSISALDPLMKVGKQVQHMLKGKHKQAEQEAIFQTMGLSRDAGKCYPFELSGGMARRVLIAAALASDASLMIADEPTPGLDEAALTDVTANIRKLADVGKGVMFVTHDIMTALSVADKIAVFYAGETVEIANVQDFQGNGENVRHPYTRALWNALPQQTFTPIAGSQPLPDEKPAGCAFAPRCPLASEICWQTSPPSKTQHGGMVRCFHA